MLETACSIAWRTKIDWETPRRRAAARRAVLSSGGTRIFICGERAIGCGIAHLGDGAFLWGLSLLFAARGGVVPAP